jgi:hypothetical protein
MKALEKQLFAERRWLQVLKISANLFRDYFK